ncbi:MAG: dienelactone hydrolase [Burkholderiaceae bacterium]
MSSSAVRRTALPIALRSMLWALLALLAAAAQAATGLAEIRRQQGQELVAVFYPTEAEGPPVQRWQFSLPLVEQAPPARGNGRLVIVSHGSPSNPWVNADLAIALTQAGFIVAAPWHQRDNSSDSSDAGPVSWKRRPHEVSAAIDAVMADPRFAPLLAADRVGAYGMSAGGLTMLALAGGRWSPAKLQEHCLAHLEEDFVTCVGPTTTSLNGDSLDRIKLSLARWVIGWKLDDPTSYGHTDARIAAVVAGVPHAAAFDLKSLATPRVPLGLITARKDVWLVPRFHGLAVVGVCTGCEWLADLAEGGHGALVSPQPRREGRIADLVDDPAGFDRATEVPATNARIVDFFKRHLLP